MSQERLKKIREYRANQPIEELERKWNKAQGRHSNHFWCTEWIDLAMCKGKKWKQFFDENLK
jgi:hypothetical protein